MSQDFKYWSVPSKEVLDRVQSTADGLTHKVAEDRLRARVAIHHRSPFVRSALMLLSQFKSPLVLLLVFGLGVSAALGEVLNSLILLVIILISGVFGFVQESSANKAAEKLRALVQTLSAVLRGGKTVKVPSANVVPGDVLLLAAGDIIPADGVILESQDLFVNESALTGESYPAEKKEGTSAADSVINERGNAVFKGTSVVSGTAKVIAVNVGAETEVGKIESEMGTTESRTAFEKGIARFGFMLMRVALILAMVILIVNVCLGKPPMDSILFALALSLGLAPEMLPAIVTVTMSAGARKLAHKKVIVKKLSAIQNLGAIDVLCCDKTGTLTDGEVKINAFLDAEGRANLEIQTLTFLNSSFETGYPNPMDDAIRKQGSVDIGKYVKLDEVPYDFIRKRLSIVVSLEGKHLMITKGALKNVLEVCTQVQRADGSTVPLANCEKDILALFEDFSAKGFRVIGVCTKDVTDDPIINKDDESDMLFRGFVTLHDPIKEGITAALADLAEKKVKLKIITGDNALIAENVALQLGIKKPVILTGKQMNGLSEIALVKKAAKVDIFAETEPSQKERIIHALQKAGLVVGYVGDGINDAPALKAADVGISVNNAVDVAKEAADLILLEKSLQVISDGIVEGRKTFLNTLKYIFITISANFGNMLSMAGASLLLPFLPLLPVQILLINFLTDLPALAIAHDRVDPELLTKPRKWDMKLIRNFMIAFGLESSFFDFLTFGALMLYFHASPETFRTGWFIESSITEVLILLIIRTPKAFFKSLPGNALLVACLVVVGSVLILPYFGFATDIGLTPLPIAVLGVMFAIAMAYAVAGEFTKRFVFRKANY